MVSGQLRQGQVISVPIGPFKHVGIVSGTSPLGEIMVISGSRRAGRVVEETLQDFAQGAPVSVEAIASHLSPIEVVRRARAKLGDTWNLVSWNCEHFVYWALGLKPHSPQLWTGIFVAIAAAIVFWPRRAS